MASWPVSSDGGDPPVRSVDRRQSVPASGAQPLSIVLVLQSFSQSARRRLIRLRPTPLLVTLLLIELVILCMTRIWLGESLEGLCSLVPWRHQTEGDRDYTVHVGSSIKEWKQAITAEPSTAR